MAKSSSLLGNSMWSIIGGLGDRVVGFVVFLMLARLLTPEHFGIVALSSLLIEIFISISKLGLSEALIHQKRMPMFMADTAFWLCNGAGLIFAVLCYLSAPHIAGYYNEPVIKDIVVVLSFSFLLVSPGLVHETFMLRQMEFKKLAIRNALATTIGGIIAVYLALEDYGVWALVVQKMVMLGTNTIFLWLAVPWRPSLRFSVRGAKKLLRFGSAVTLSNAVWIANGRIHELILAASLGTEAVGYYRIAMRGFQMITDIILKPITRVAFSALALQQAHPEKLAATYRYFVMASALIALPCYIGASLISDELIITVFGPQWTQSAILFPIIALISIPMVVTVFESPLFNAIGRPSFILCLASGQTVVSAVMTYYAVDYGLEAVTWAQAIKAYLILPVILFFVQRYTSIKPLKIITSVLPFLIACGAMSAAVLAVQPYIPTNMPATGYIIISVTVGAIAYGIVMAIFMRTVLRSEISAIVSLLPSKFQKLFKFCT